ncbi:hypothetical protein CDD83_4970 [Cordyceps sp. RAO-2017]|nr:hypothetical protein CDD83_4970 [Cordyceps sp. RAO-2017]
MWSYGGLFFAHLASLAAPVVAQLGPWQDHQINTTICFWKQPRAALLRDTVYLDGGNIFWTPGLDSGVLGDAVNLGNLQGLVLSYNLSEPFTPATNVTEILLKNAETKTRGSKNPGLSDFPNAYDGGMLANDAEFFLYGGTLFRDDTLYSLPAADAVMEYQAYRYGADKPLMPLGFRSTHLNGGVNSYIAFGAAANAPSENKAWYFSGLTSPTRGPIYANPSLNGSTSAKNISNTLITLDMTTQLEEKWSNATLPKDIKGRSNAEVVWVPVGRQGILVVLGGVVYPEWATIIHQSENKAASEKESPEFMRVIDIYDIAGDKWYKQPTQAGPGTRSRGCAVVAPAADYSSFNIYYYGGFDGIHPMGSFYDDVWVLSLPSFTWTQINKGVDLHARSGHKCFLPYPDQMMVFGGYASEPGEVPSCLDKGPIVLFNISSGEWMDSYDPKKYGKYAVPEKVRAAIGGDGSGGATATAPVPSGWATSGLADVFAQKYDTHKIKEYWPYGSASAAGGPGLPVEEKESDGDRKRVLIPAILVPIVFLAGAAVVAWWCCRNGKSFGGKTSRSSGSDEAAMRIRSWVWGQAAGKSVTMTSSAASPDPEMAKTASSVHSCPAPEPSPHHEMADTQLVELGDTSPPAELHDTGLSPIEVIQKHSNFASNRARSPTVPSQNSMSGLGDNGSFVSRTSGAANSARLDSPLLGATSLADGIARPFAPGAGGEGQRRDALPPMSEEQAPVSPPTTGDELTGIDYLSAGESPVLPGGSAVRENNAGEGRSK